MSSEGGNEKWGRRDEYREELQTCLKALVVPTDPPLVYSLMQEVKYSD